MLVDPVRREAADDPLVPPGRRVHLAVPALGGVPVVADVVVVEDHRARQGRQQPPVQRVGPGQPVEVGVLLEVLQLLARRLVEAAPRGDELLHLLAGLVGVDLVAEEADEVWPVGVHALGSAQVVGVGPQRVDAVAGVALGVVRDAGAAGAERQPGRLAVQQGPDPAGRQPGVLRLRLRPDPLVVDVDRVVARRAGLEPVEHDQRVVPPVRGEGRRRPLPAEGARPARPRRRGSAPRPSPRSRRRSGAAAPGRGGPRRGEWSPDRSTRSATSGHGTDVPRKLRTRGPAATHVLGSVTSYRVRRDPVIATLTKGQSCQRHPPHLRPEAHRTTDSGARDTCRSGGCRSGRALLGSVAAGLGTWAVLSPLAGLSLSATTSTVRTHDVGAAGGRALSRGRHARGRCRRRPGPAGLQLSPRRTFLLVSGAMLRALLQRPDRSGRHAWASGLGLGLLHLVVAAAVVPVLAAGPAGPTRGADGERLPWGGTRPGATRQNVRYAAVPRSQPCSPGRGCRGGPPPAGPCSGELGLVASSAAGLDRADHPALAVGRPGRRTGPVRPARPLTRRLGPGTRRADLWPAVVAHGCRDRRPGRGHGPALGDPAPAGRDLDRDQCPVGLVTVARRGDSCRRGCGGRRPGAPRGTRRVLATGLTTLPRRAAHLRLQLAGAGDRRAAPHSRWSWPGRRSAPSGCRFSRDLHDLLGHSLSVIAVKAQAARRAAPTGPGRGRRARRATSRPSPVTRSPACGRPCRATAAPASTPRWTGPRKPCGLPASTPRSCGTSEPPVTGAGGAVRLGGPRGRHQRAAPRARQPGGDPPDQRRGGRRHRGHRGRRRRAGPGRGPARPRDRPGPAGWLRPGRAARTADRHGWHALDPGRRGRLPADRPAAPHHGPDRDHPPPTPPSRPPCSSPRTRS